MITFYYSSFDYNCIQRFPKTFKFIFCTCKEYVTGKVTILSHQKIKIIKQLIVLTVFKTILGIYDILELISLSMTMLVFLGRLHPIGQNGHKMHSILIYSFNWDYINNTYIVIRLYILKQRSGQQVRIANLDA